eukprot:1181536-Prorocentrum_minimum.AAC.1
MKGTPVGVVYRARGSVLGSWEDRPPTAYLKQIYLAMDESDAGRAGRAGEGDTCVTPDAGRAGEGDTCATQAAGRAREGGSCVMSDAGRAREDGSCVTSDAGRAREGDTCVTSDAGRAPEGDTCVTHVLALCSLAFVAFICFSICASQSLGQPVSQ